MRVSMRSDGGPGADYPRLSRAFPGGVVPSLPGEAARLLAQSGAPD